MFENAKMLQIKRENFDYKDWQSNFVDFTEDNIEKYFPLDKYSRNIIWCSSCSGGIHPGFHTWKQVAEDTQERLERVESELLMVGKYYGRIQSVVHGYDRFMKRKNR